MKGHELPAYPQPLWDGSPLAGRTILLHPEQGLGDTIHFGPLCPPAQGTGAAVLCHCPGRLLGVLKTCPGIDELIPADTAPPPFDVRAPLLSLPRLFGTTVATIPASVPYLSASARLVDAGAAAWQPSRASRSASPGRGADLHEGPSAFVPLELFEPLARVPGVQLISLQKGPVRGAGSRVAGRFPLDLGPELDQAAGPYGYGSRADQSRPGDHGRYRYRHLAAERPDLAAQCFMPHWPWLLDREDSPWYPTGRDCSASRGRERGARCSPA